jgi:hypothetical protein
MSQESNSLFLFYLYIFLSPFALYLGIKFRKWKIRYHILFIQCVITLILLVFACFQDSEPHYLLGMTKFQEFILFTVGISYVIDSIDIILSYKETKKTIDIYTLIMHHIPGYIGILFMLYVHQCGGIIVRLLFDSVEYTLQNFDYMTEFKYTNTIDDLEEIAFFVMRVCYYSVLGIYGIFVMIIHWNFINKILFVLYTIWNLNVLNEHLYLGFWKKNRFRLKEIYDKWIKGKKNIWKDL